ncbi:MAG: carbon storage regulator [Planctomycetaceae bacterium]
MLVLTRKIGEEIVIDGSVRVRVIQCGNGRVRLGIVAPQDVRIMRSEIAFEDECPVDCGQMIPSRPH